MNIKALTGVVQETKYRTTDGFLFDEKSLADSHQFDIDHKEELWWIPSNLRCEAPYDTEQYNAKPMSTHELARLLLEHPEMSARTHDGMKIDRVTTEAYGGKLHAKIGEAPCI